MTRIIYDLKLLEIIEKTKEIKKEHILRFVLKRNKKNLEKK